LLGCSLGVAASGWFQAGIPWNRYCCLYLLSARVVELVLDKQPWIGARTKPGPLIFRLITGGLSGAALGSTLGYASGAILGGVGALVGAFGGYHTRHRIVSNLKVPDILVALVEDVLAVGGALLIVSRFS